MSLRLAVWCPHGRAALPLAARLLASQLPEELVAWRSEQAAPARLHAEVQVDLWLVLCAEPPPPPPCWRNETTGRWLVFPGTAVKWSAETAAALEAWPDDGILSDLLPDESENPFLQQWFRSKDLIWLPAWMKGFGAARGTQPDGVIGGSEELAGTEAEVILEAVRVALALPSGRAGRVAERAEELAERVTAARRGVLATTDPVLAGIAQRLATQRGTSLLLYGVTGSPMRQTLLAGVAATMMPLRAAADPLRSVATRLLAHLHADPQNSKREVPPIFWEDWAAALTAGQGAPATAGGRAARIIAECRDSARELAGAQSLALAAKLIPTQAWCVFPPAVTHPAALVHFARAPVGADLYTLLHHLSKSVPGWTEAAGRWGVESRDPRWGALLWMAVCDGFLTTETEQCAATVSEIFEASRSLPLDAPALLEVRCVVAATIGRFADAEEDLAALVGRCGEGAAVGTMMVILRAWIPAARLGSAPNMPAGAFEWWEKRMRGLCAAQLQGAAAVMAFGELWLGSSEASRSWIAQATPAVCDAAWFALHAWMSGADALGAELWAGWRGVALPDAPDQQLPVIAAKAVFEAADSDLLRVYLELVGRAPGLFERLWPSQIRCFLSALICRRLGDDEGASRWSEAARRNETLGRLLLPLLERA